MQEKFLSTRIFCMSSDDKQQVTDKIKLSPIFVLQLGEPVGIVLFTQRGGRKGLQRRPRSPLDFEIKHVHFHFSVEKYLSVGLEFVKWNLTSVAPLEKCFRPSPGKVHLCPTLEKILKNLMSLRIWAFVRYICVNHIIRQSHFLNFRLACFAQNQL